MSWSDVNFDSTNKLHEDFEGLQESRLFLHLEGQISPSEMFEYRCA